MGKTVVYSVLVTTRREEAVTVEFAGIKGTELEARGDDTAELIGAADGVASDTDAATDELMPEELINALLRVAEP